jgi:hypothetical protein
MPLRRLAGLLALAAMTPLTLQGCAASEGGGNDDADHESEPPREPTGAPTAAPTGGPTQPLAGGVDCKTTQMTAYDNGKPYPIDVIEIDGKRVSLPTGHAYLKMQQAAEQAGVKMTITSGFRTQEEQQYLYNCYKTGSCNNGNLAAKPGYSNHQNGRALDLPTSSWLAENAGSFGFKRTVPSEAWHYEFFGTDPGGSCSAGGSAPGVTPLSAPSPAPSNGGGGACSSDGDCNPGSEGSGLMCESHRCVPGCHSDAQCAGAKTCHAGQCR